MDNLIKTRYLIIILLIYTFFNFLVFFAIDYWQVSYLHYLIVIIDILLLLVLLLVLKDKLKLKALVGGFGQVKISELAGGANIVLVSALLSVSIYIIVLYFIELPDYTLITSLPMAIELLVSGVVIAPIFEEFLFRGLLLHRLAIKWNITSAIILSSVLFGVLHAEDFIGATVFGILMSILYFKTRTLIVPIILHFLNNLFTLGSSVFLFMLGIEIPEYPPHLSDIIFGLELILISGALLGYYIYKNWPNKTTELPYFWNKRLTILK